MKISSLLNSKKTLNFDLSNPFFNNSGLILFQIGVLLLASAPAISIFFLVFSTIFGFVDRNDNFLKDKFNYPFILSSVLMLFNTLKYSV